MALRATWQCHAGPRSTYAAFISIYFIYILFIMGIQPSVYRKGIQPIRSSGVINPTFFFNLFRVRLKSHTIYFNAGGGVNRRVGSRSERADRVDTRSTNHRSSMCLLNQVITAMIDCDVAASHTSDQRRDN